MHVSRLVSHRRKQAQQQEPDGLLGPGRARSFTGGGAPSAIKKMMDALQQQPPSSEGHRREATGGTGGGHAEAGGGGSVSARQQQPTPPPPASGSSTYHDRGGTAQASATTRSSKAPARSSSEVRGRPSTAQQGAASATAKGTLDDWKWGPTATAGAGDCVVVHVFDEVRGVSRDFLCKRDVLSQQVDYFHDYLVTNGDGSRNGSRSGTPTQPTHGGKASGSHHHTNEINVHCDISVFRWLMEYSHSCHGHTPKPVMDAKIAVSVLISSDFLRMRNLLGDAVRYVAHHLGDILRLPIDMACIGKELQRKMAESVPDLVLDGVRDKRDRIVNTLFLWKLRGMMCRQDPNHRGRWRSILQRCTACGRLYSSELEGPLTHCTSGTVVISQRGSAVAPHRPCKAFNAANFLLSLRKAGLGWGQVYWRVWSLVNWDVCSACGATFPMAEMFRCSYHTQQAVVDTAKEVSLYLCCGQGKGSTGCMFREHKPTLYPQQFAIARDVSVAHEETFLKASVLSNRDVLSVTAIAPPPAAPTSSKPSAATDSKPASSNNGGGGGGCVPDKGGLLYALEGGGCGALLGSLKMASPLTAPPATATTGIGAAPFQYRTDLQRCSERQRMRDQAARMASMRYEEATHHVAGGTITGATNSGVPGGSTNARPPTGSAGSGAANSNDGGKTAAPHLRRVATAGKIRSAPRWS